MSGLPIVLLPHRPRRSRASRVLPWLTVPAFGLVLAADWALTSAGLAPPVRPLGLRLLLAAVLWGPGLMWALAPHLGRIPGLSWLVDSRPLSLTLDETGFTLRDGAAEATHPWSEVVRLTAVEGEEVVLHDGTRIRIPEEIRRGRGADGSRTTLIDELDRVQPALARRDARRADARKVAYGAMGMLLVMGIILGIILLAR